MSTPISCIVGLCNPGSEYALTRHNAGAWFVEQLADQYNELFKTDKKFFAQTAKITTPSGVSCWLILPNTFMNKSGQAVGAFCHFHKLSVDRLLVVHDELDLPPGTVRLKQGGGHGGHNGLKDIIKSLGNDASFNRLRIGIGHPGHPSKVTGYVLKPPSRSDQTLINGAIDEALAHQELILNGRWQETMNTLHRYKG